MKQYAVPVVCVVAVALLLAASAGLAVAGNNSQGQEPAAVTAALFLAACWFAYLHTQMGPAGLVSTVLLGTLYALPISYLCLYRYLETAIGFQFFIDFVRFLAAFLALRAGM